MNYKTNRVAILQPLIPHYRASFFQQLSQKRDVKIFRYANDDKSFNLAGVETTPVSNLEKGPFLLYNPLTILKGNFTHLVLMLHFGHITTWLLLLTKFVHRKKIILWGQGISVKRYLKEEKKPDWKLKAMLALADGAWLYTEKEAAQWKDIFPHKKIVALNNTQNVQTQSKLNDEQIKKLKEKYNIKQERVLIFAARFENPYRRTDLLIEVIKKLDPDKFGFIIIGDGSLKPDFSMYENVYDFGKLYDEEIKRDLFGLSDIYFQPGWVGLSIVEAMAYSLPIFTFKRDETTLQCVEYSYVSDGINGFLLSNLSDCLGKIVNTSQDKLDEMGKKAQEFYKTKLTVEKMVENAISIL